MERRFTALQRLDWLFLPSDRRKKRTSLLHGDVDVAITVIIEVMVQDAFGMSQRFKQFALKPQKSLDSLLSLVVHPSAIHRSSPDCVLSLSIRIKSSQTSFTMIAHSQLATPHQLMLNNKMCD